MEEPPTCQAAVMATGAQYDGLLLDPVLCVLYADHVGPHKGYTSGHTVGWGRGVEVTVNVTPEGEPPW